MTTSSQSEFARLEGVNRSTVTRWKADGRLVLDATGNVLVDESRAKIAETAGGRDDVAARHAVERDAAAEAIAAVIRTEPAIAAIKSGTRASGQARKENAQADMAEMERDMLLGRLVEKAEVVAIVADVMIAFRQSFENMPHSVAPGLVGRDQDAVRLTLKEEVRDRLEALEKALAQDIQSLGRNTEVAA